MEDQRQVQELIQKGLKELQLLKVGYLRGPGTIRLSADKGSTPGSVATAGWYPSFATLLVRAHIHRETGGGLVSAYTN